MSKFKEGDEVQVNAGYNNFEGHVGLITRVINEQDKMWRAPNGARLRFAYLERDQDADGYQGHSYSFAPQRRAPGLIEGRARHVKDDDDFVQHNPDDMTLAVGDRVFHQKFGYGRIREMEGNKLLIGFEKAGEKKVIASFVQKA